MTDSPTPAGTGRPRRALLIGSQVMRGGVGMSLAGPALEMRGVEAWVLPTAILATRPGLGRMARHGVPAETMAQMIAALDADGALAGIDAVLAGWFADEAQVAVAADAIAAVKRTRGDALIVCDPVMGDAGPGLYVPEAVADAIARQLIPHADVTTPNHFELERLAGGGLETRVAAIAAARALGPRLVVTTSSAVTAERIESLIVTPTEVRSAGHARARAVPNGVGDLFAALLMAEMLERTAAPVAAAIAALDATSRVAAASTGATRLDLRALCRR